jgi:hypothetical protein
VGQKDHRKRACRYGPPKMGHSHAGLPQLGRPLMGHSHTGSPELGRPLMGHSHTGSPELDRHNWAVHYWPAIVSTKWAHSSVSCHMCACMWAPMSTCQNFMVPRVGTVVGHLQAHVGILTDTCRHANGHARGTCQPSNSILHGHVVGGGWSGVIS